MFSKHMSIVMGAVLVSAAGFGIGAPAMAGVYEDRVAFECAVSNRGEPRATALCISARLTQAEINKCQNGIGNQGGCFGPTNDVRRFVENGARDLTQGPGPNNEVRKIGRAIGLPW